MVSVQVCCGEPSFEAYLQWHRLCYVAVDETRRAQLGVLAHLSSIAGTNSRGSPCVSCR